MTGRRALISSTHLLLLVLAGAVVLATSEARDWAPIELVLLLLVLAIGSDVLTIEFRGIRISGSFLALVLAMALLGPAPAAAIGVLATAIDAVLYRRPWHRNLMNLAVWAWFPIIGSLIIEGLAGEAAPGSENALGFAGARRRRLHAHELPQLRDGGGLAPPVARGFVPREPDLGLHHRAAVAVRHRAC